MLCCYDEVMIVCLSGENHYSLRAELERLTEAFVSVHGDMAVERLDGGTASYERLRESLQSLPFFAARKLVIMRAPGSQKLFTEHVESLLKELPESTDVILIEPKIDKRSLYFKALKKYTDFRECAVKDAAGLARWLSEEAAARGGSLAPGDAQFMVERLGTEQQLLSNELDKLLLFNAAVTRSSIELLSEPSPQSSIFELLEAAFSGDHARVLKLYKEQREQKVDTAQIIAMLTWQFRIVALIKTAGDRSTQEIASVAKLNPFVVRKSETIARRLPLARLKRLVRDLLTIDVRSKRTSLDVDGALQNFLLSLTDGT